MYASVLTFLQQAEQQASPPCTCVCNRRHAYLDGLRGGVTLTLTLPCRYMYLTLALALTLTLTLSLTLTLTLSLTLTPTPRHMYLDVLRGCFLFHGLKARFLDELLGMARMEIFMPGVSRRGWWRCG